MISIDDFKKVEIRAGKILSAEKIEGSDKLLKLSVDFGEENPRTVLSGIAKHISPEDLANTICGFVTNLEPRSIMGMESQAMIMAVSGESSESNPDGFFSLMKLADNVPAGSLVK